jgi:hypothetical protein
MWHEEVTWYLMVRHVTRCVRCRLAGGLSAAEGALCRTGRRLRQTWAAYQEDGDENADE